MPPTNPRSLRIPSNHFSNEYPRTTESLTPCSSISIVLLHGGGIGPAVYGGLTAFAIAELAECDNLFQRESEGSGQHDDGSAAEGRDQEV